MTRIPLSEPFTASEADPRWPAPLRLLLGPQAADLLQAVLGEVGGRLLALRAAGAGVQPDGSAVVQYVADVATAEGLRTREVLAATTGTRIPTGAAVLAGEVDGGPVRVGLWRRSQDPALPGLAWATRPAALTRWLHDHDLDLGPAPTIRVRAYRPGRRAVLEVRGDGVPLFLKVVRPAAVVPLRRRHDLLAGNVPAAPILAATADGVVALPELPGIPLRGRLTGDGPLPHPAVLDALLDRLPPAVAALPRAGRHAPGDHLARAAHLTAVLAAIAPELRPGLEAVADALGAADPGVHPPVPVHGDYYEAGPRSPSAGWRSRASASPAADRG